MDEHSCLDCEKCIKTSVFGRLYCETADRYVQDGDGDPPWWCPLEEAFNGDCED